MEKLLVYADCPTVGDVHYLIVENKSSQLMKKELYVGYLHLII